MPDTNDEKIQELIEKNLSAALIQEDKDVKAYAFVFEAISQEPEIMLPNNFSAKVTSALLAKKYRKEDLRLFILLAMALIGFMAGAYFYLNSSGSAPGAQLLISLLKYKWIILFGTAMLFIIQFLDVRYLRARIQEAL